MLTGRSYKNQPPGTRLSQLRSDIPAALDELVAKMLSEDPRQRPWDGAAAEQLLGELAAADPAPPPVRSVPAVPAPVWTLDDGLSALAGMETAQEWQLAEELLKQLEAAYPGNPKLILPRKRINQALAVIQEEKAQAERRAAEERAAREAAERARQAELARKKAEAEARLEREATDRARREAEKKNSREVVARSRQAEPTTKNAEMEARQRQVAAERTRLEYDKALRARNRRRKLGPYFALAYIAVLLLALGGSIVWMLDRLGIGNTTACTRIGQNQISPVDGMKLMCVPAGNFLMGSSDEDDRATDDEKPQHEVYLDAYWMDQTEITNSQYMQCVSAGACRSPEDNENVIRVNYFDNPYYNDYPVTQVSWDDANDYCRWAGRQLPTEAQWEKAARGSKGNIFPWGNQLRVFPVLNSSDDSYDLYPVGSYRSYPSNKSPYSVYDMSHNVYEWTLDWYSESYYSSQTTWRNPTGPTSGEYRVVRSGVGIMASLTTYSASRRGDSPDLRGANLGFRCCLIAAP